MVNKLVIAGLVSGGGYGGPGGQVDQSGRLQPGSGGGFSVTTGWTRAWPRGPTDSCFRKQGH